MCGIIGWLKYENPLVDSEINEMRKALSSMRHRGPDFQGEWFSECIYMGHQRLSIIDLSSSANQPFIDENQQYVIAFNGEIYNYLELKAELIKEGCSFRTTSDTEVLLKAFIVWGKEAFLKFDGMFAAAIHDIRARKHYLFRDPLGQKPLYYYAYEGGLIYSSELRGILGLSKFPWRVDRNNFLKFLSNCCYMWDSTPLDGVKKLLPGHYLEIENGKPMLKRYWNSIPGENIEKLDLQEALRHFRKLFENSCGISMRSDVPYGVFLSGGIDSSLILVACHRFNDGIASFSVMMGEADFDESSKVNVVTEHLRIKLHHSYLMDSDSVQESVDAFFEFSDEPHGDPGFVNEYFLAKSCRPEVTVAISGDGADELFAGYLPFAALEKENLLEPLPGPVIGGGRWFARQLLPGNDRYMGLKSKALAFLQGFPSQAATRFPLWLSAIAPEDLSRLCPWQAEEFFSRNGEPGTLFAAFEDELGQMDGKSRNQMFLYYYQKFFLPEFVCMHTDRASMQSSLEVRSPYLSLPLVEFANKLPDHLKIHKGVLKRLLRQEMAKRGYPETIYGQKKQGFTFPLARWLKTVLKTRMEELLSPEQWDDNLIDVAFMQQLKDEHLNGKNNHYRILYNLMVFRQWLKSYPQIIL